MRALFTAPAATFSPETFEADWGRAVRAGKRATLTVKTSADVESITVDGQSITSYTTRTQRTGWGWWSPKVTYHVFTYTITAPAQTTDYAVCAVRSNRNHEILCITHRQLRELRVEHEYRRHLREPDSYPCGGYMRH